MRGWKRTERKKRQRGRKEGRKGEEHMERKKEGKMGREGETKKGKDAIKQGSNRAVGVGGADMYILRR